MADPGADVAELVEAKRASGTTISVCLPARNEEATVGQIVATVRRNLIEHAALVDEVVVIDDGSTDATAEAARGRAPGCSAVDEILPELPRGSGKGNALWMSLYACDGDIVCWLDADVRNFGAALRDPAARAVAARPRDRVREGLLPAAAARRGRPAAGASPSSWPGP